MFLCVCLIIGLLEDNYICSILVAYLQISKICNTQVKDW